MNMGVIQYTFWNVKFNYLQKIMTVDDINWFNLDNQLYEDVICGVARFDLMGGESWMKNIIKVLSSNY